MASQRSPMRKTLASLLTFGAFAWLLYLWCIDSTLRPGRETTFITGPLNAQGQIDYAAVIHQRLSEGVSPENNAAVLIDHAFGPSAISSELRQLYFERMSVDWLPEQGDYVIAQGDFQQKMFKESNASSDQQESIQRQFARATEQTWTHAECPIVAEWLAANDKQLELIERASQKSRYYSPLVTSGRLFESETTTQNLREAARLLMTRAMLRLGEKTSTAPGTIYWLATSLRASSAVVQGT